MNDPSRVRVSGPLEPFAARFVHSLLRQGYTPLSAVAGLQVDPGLRGVGEGVEGASCPAPCV